MFDLFKKSQKNENKKSPIRQVCSDYSKRTFDNFGANFIAASCLSSNLSNNATARRLDEKFTLPCVLSIAGSDSSGGAGIQADIKTIQSLGLFAETAISAITAQNTTGVRAVQNIDPKIIEAQIDAVFEDIPPAAVKIGMVSTPEIACAIARALIRNNAKNIVLDPVMVATSGSSLAEDDAVQAMRDHLFGFASVITPNLSEAELLAGFSIKGAEDAVRAAHVIQDECRSACDNTNESLCEHTEKSAKAHAEVEANSRERANSFVGVNKDKHTCAVLIKGGHGLQGPQRAVPHSNESASDDFLLTADGAEAWLYGIRIDNPNTHGTGCTLSSAIASYLALGYGIPQAVGAAKDFLTGAISARLDMGAASGPLDHFWQFRERV